MTEEKKDQEAVEEAKEFHLDIACGNNKRDGYVGIDCVKTDSVDIVHDLNVYPWVGLDGQPIPDNSVDSVQCSHYIEHIPMLCKCCASEKDPLFVFFDELYRIMKPEAKAYIVAPYYNSRRCWQDPTHRRAISEATFMYMNKQWREANKLDHYNVICDFDFGYSYSVAYPWGTKYEETRNFALNHYSNVAEDIIVTMTKRG